MSVLHVVEEKVRTRFERVIINGHFEPNAQNVMVRNIYLAFPLVLVNNN